MKDIWVPENIKNIPPPPEWVKGLKQQESKEKKNQAKT